MSVTIILKATSTGEHYRVPLPCVIGRGETVDLPLKDLSISHRHARISSQGNRLWIEDLKSVNGVFINKHKIEKKSVVNYGDTLTLGQMHFTVLEHEEDVSQQTLVMHTLGPQTSAELDQQRLSALYAIAAELSGSQDMKTLGAKIFARLKEIFQFDRGYVALFTKDGDLQPLLVEPASISLPLSRSIVKRVFQHAESFLLEDALGDSSLSVQESIVKLRIRSALCVPLICHDQIYGLMYLDRHVPGAYKPADLEFLKSIAAILAPLIENAYLWSELQNHYDHAVETLKKTQTRLIETERTAAYVYLAQAMAHELRNPLMIIGGLAHKIAAAQAHTPDASYSALQSAVERMELVLRELDLFVNTPPPHLQLYRIDQLLQEGLREYQETWQRKSIDPRLIVDTPHVMLPLDPYLMRKAISMVFKEIVFGIPDGAVLPISLYASENELVIEFGQSTAQNQNQWCDPYAPEVQAKPWFTSLFLAIAHKILIDHGGKLFINAQANAAYPLRLRIPRVHLQGERIPGRV